MGVYSGNQGVRLAKVIVELNKGCDTRIRNILLGAGRTWGLGTTFPAVQEEAT